MILISPHHHMHRKPKRQHAVRRECHPQESGEEENKEQDGLSSTYMNVTNLQATKQTDSSRHRDGPRPSVWSSAAADGGPVLERLAYQQGRSKGRTDQRAKCLISKFYSRTAPLACGCKYTGSSDVDKGGPYFGID